MRHIIAAALLWSAGALPTHAETLAGPYAAEIVRVIDGDTIEAKVHLWLGLDQTLRVRIRDIDAPEMHGNCPGEPEAAAAARDHLATLLGQGPVTLTRIAHDKYGGRVDAALALPTGQDVAAAMLSSRHARPWPHPKGASRCPQFPLAAGAAALKP